MARLNLIWTNKLSKFLSEDPARFQINGDIIVIGQTVSLEDLNKLLTKYGDCNITYSYVTEDQSHVQARAMYEQFYLGMAAAGGNEFYVYGGMTETTANMAKTCGVVIAGDNVRIKGKEKAKETPSVKEPVSKEQAKEKDPEKEIPKKTAPEKKEKKSTILSINDPTPANFGIPVRVFEPREEETEVIIPEKKKRAPKGEPKKAKEEGASLSAKEKADFILGILNKSNLSAEDKEWFGTAGRLSMIEDVVKKSTKETVKFQVRMMFGDKGGVIEGLITKNWDALEKTLVG